MSDDHIDLDMPSADPNGALHVNGNGGGARGGSGSASPPPPTAAASAAAASGGASFVNKPSFLECPYGRFLIMDAPNDNNVHTYFDVLKKRQVVVLVRVCDPTYAAAHLLGQGIQVVDIPFPDGDPPPQPVVDKWLALVDQVFKHNGAAPKGHESGVGDLSLAGVSKPAIAIHCVAGLGRAPVMVALALVQNGMEPFDAIAFIRKKRRGAINARQLKYIEGYKRKKAPQGCCTVQ